MSSKKSSKLEKKAAKDFPGGQAQIASGALPFWKQDIDADDFLIEHKYTEPFTKSFTIKKQYAEEVIKNALLIGKLPMMIIEFTGRPELKIAVVRYEEAVALAKYISKELHGAESEGACKEE